MKLSPKGRSNNLFVQCVLKLFWGRKRGARGREEEQGGRKCLGTISFIIIIFSLIMATVYKGEG